MWQAMLKSRKASVLAAACCVVLFGGGAWYYDVGGWREPPCVPGQDCGRRLEEVDWNDPSFALVQPDETFKELRWYKGKLLHPVGRVFGGHHSTLVATGSSGLQVRVEKFGLGSVEYCPTRLSSKCNLAPGEVYKSAGGRFLKNITWRELHREMVDDLLHYDIIDANCHHAVQRGWNAAVISSVQDKSPAPDDGVARYWEGFLRWFHGTADDESEPQEASAPARSLDAATNASNTTATTTETTTAAPSLAPPAAGGTTASILANTLNTRTAELGLGQGEIDVNQWGTSFDGPFLRRRRRTPWGAAERCRGSKLEGRPTPVNCPDRESSLSEESSSNGGASSKKESEFSGSKRSRMLLFFKLYKDSDSSGSDCSFQRSMSSGGEQDISGSMHKRYQCSRPSSQSASSEDSQQMNILPMDPARVRCDSKGDRAGSSVSYSEIGHSQYGRSKGDDAHVCNTRLEGVESVSSEDFICQWTCVAGEIGYNAPTVAQFKCTEGQGTIDVSVEAGQTYSDCLSNCASGGCATDCTSNCKYLSSAMMDAGLGMCLIKATGNVTSNEKELEVIPMSGSEYAAAIFWALVPCMGICCQMCKKKKDSQVHSRF